MRSSSLTAQSRAPFGLLTPLSQEEAHRFVMTGDLPPDTAVDESGRVLGKNTPDISPNGALWGALKLACKEMGFGLVIGPALNAPLHGRFTNGWIMLSEHPAMPTLTSRIAAILDHNVEVLRFRATGELGPWANMTCAGTAKTVSPTGDTATLSIPGIQEEHRVEDLMGEPIKSRSQLEQALEELILTMARPVLVRRGVGSGEWSFSIDVPVNLKLAPRRPLKVALRLGRGPERLTLHPLNATLMIDLLDKQRCLCGQTAAPALEPLRTPRWLADTKIARGKCSVNRSLVPMFKLTERGIWRVVPREATIISTALRLAARTSPLHKEKILKWAAWFKLGSCEVEVIKFS